MPWNCLCASKSKNRRPQISAPILNVSDFIEVFKEVNKSFEVCEILCICKFEKQKEIDVTELIK